MLGDRGRLNKLETNERLKSLNNPKAYTILGSLKDIKRIMENFSYTEFHGNHFHQFQIMAYAIDRRSAIKLLLLGS